MQDDPPLKDGIGKRNPRRDWVIALSAALVGIVGVPLYSQVASLVGSGPHLHADLVYGPYVQLPDSALSKQGYTVPEKKNSLKFTGENGVGTGFNTVESFQDPDLRGDMGQPQEDDAFSARNLFVQIRLRNSGSSPAQSVFLHDPFAGLVTIGDGNTEQTFFVKSEGAKLPVGEILPGQSRVARMWFIAQQSPDFLESKATGQINIFQGPNESAVPISRRGFDSVSSYLASTFGLWLFGFILLGAFLALAIAVSLLSAAFKFLLPDVYRRISEANGTAKKTAI